MRTEAFLDVDVEMFLKRGILDINDEEEVELEEEDVEEADADEDASLASELRLDSEPVLGSVAFMSPKNSSASLTAVPCSTPAKARTILSGR